MANNNGGEKNQITTSKTFLAVGPTLHYSHTNVLTFWLLTVTVYAGVCLFWSKILTGSIFAFNPESIFTFRYWILGRSLMTGINIFEYPWQILVLALLMAIMAVAPVLTAQLLSFGYSLPMILAVFFLANLPILAICLLISCIAVACRPLRFRSRFASISLCLVPQLLYWFVLGGARGVEPIKWGFSYTPWIGAWLIGLAMAGMVVGIGHFTRYRPGLIFLSSLMLFAISFFVFKFRIGFDELDYQLYVARNNPEQVSEFFDHSIVKPLDRAIMDPAVKKYLGGFFYPTEAIVLRKELKSEIISQLAHDRWPTWFDVPEQFQYQEKRQWLMGQYELFITSRPKSKRMPIALYYKALLSEYAPDSRILEEQETLHFYSDYPFDRSRLIWYRLYSEFGSSPESLEARWRIAMLWAGQGRFDQAEVLISDALTLLDKRLAAIDKEQPVEESLFSLFHPPADSVQTVTKLTDLQRKLKHLANLISPENRTNKPESAKRLARFVMLNQNDSGYQGQLEELLSEISKNDPLRDNILLAIVKIIPDEQLRAERLAELNRQCQNTDAGCQALYELALLKIHFWRQQNDNNIERKKQYLADAKAVLNNFLKLYPDSFSAQQVRNNLINLPSSE